MKFFFFTIDCSYTVRFEDEVLEVPKCYFKSGPAFEPAEVYYYPENELPLGVIVRSDNLGSASSVLEQYVRSIQPQPENLQATGT